MPLLLPSPYPLAFLPGTVARQSLLVSRSSSSHFTCFDGAGWLGGSAWSPWLARVVIAVTYRVFNIWIPILVGYLVARRMRIFGGRATARKQAEQAYDA